MVIHQFDNAAALPLCPGQPSLKSTTEIENYVFRTLTPPCSIKTSSSARSDCGCIHPAEPAARAPACREALLSEWVNACATMYGKCKGTYCTCTIMRMHLCTHTLAHAVPYMELFAQPISAASYFCQFRPEPPPMLVDTSASMWIENLGCHADISPFRGATDSHVLDFWWCLTWVSKPEWIPFCMLSRLCDPQVHFWCNTSWLYGGPPKKKLLYCVRMPVTHHHISRCTQYPFNTWLLNC